MIAATHIATHYISGWLSHVFTVIGLALGPEDNEIGPETEEIKTPEKPEDLLRKIRTRARAIITFSYRMEKEDIDLIERNRQMNMARAHVKGLRMSVQKYLKVEQPDWYKLDGAGRTKAILTAFKEAEQGETAQLLEDDGKSDRD